MNALVYANSEEKYSRAEWVILSSLNLLFLKSDVWSETQEDNGKIVCFLRRGFYKLLRENFFLVCTLFRNYTYPTYESTESCIIQLWLGYEIDVHHGRNLIFLRNSDNLKNFFYSLLLVLYWRKYFFFFASDSK